MQIGVTTIAESWVNIAMGRVRTPAIQIDVALGSLHAVITV